MFAGHVGVALAIGRAGRSLNLGALVFAALLLDIVLWLFVLLGWERVIIPASFATTHQLEFVFPYSHGLLAAIAWSALAGATAFVWYSRRSVPRLRATLLITLAVFSHWPLDALVHVPEMPVAGGDSFKVGFSLWQHLPVALAVEAIITIAGLWVFLSDARLSRSRKVWLTVLSLSLVAFTVAGMTVAPPPPSVTAIAATSLATLAVVCALTGWLGKREA